MHLLPTCLKPVLHTHRQLTLPSTWYAFDGGGVQAVHWAVELHKIAELVLPNGHGLWTASSVLMTPFCTIRIWLLFSD